MLYAIVRSDGSISQICMGHQPNGAIEISQEIANNAQNYTYQNGQFVLTPVDPPLSLVQEQKMQELNDACGAAILGNFSSTVNGVTYQFSNDAEAQDNFKDGLWALENNKLTMVKWTAYDANGSVVRLDLDLPTLQSVNVDRLTHKQNMVSKFRDTLQPKVYDPAATVESVRAITWQSS